MSHSYTFPSLLPQLSPTSHLLISPFSSHPYHLLPQLPCLPRHSPHFVDIPLSSLPYCASPRFTISPSLTFLHFLLLTPLNTPPNRSWLPFLYNSFPYPHFPFYTVSRIFILLCPLLKLPSRPCTPQLTHTSITITYYHSHNYRFPTHTHFPTTPFSAYFRAIPLLSLPLLHLHCPRPNPYYFSPHLHTPPLP